MPATYHVEPFTSAKRHQLPSYRVVGRSTPLHLGAKAARPRTPRLRPSQALSCLDPPERIDHTPAVGGLFEAEPCHRRWSRFPVSPSAGGASRLDSPQKGPLPLRQPDRFALALGDGQRIAPDATKPDGIAGAAGRWRRQRPSRPPARRTCGPGRPCASAPASLPVAPHAPGASCPGTASVAPQPSWPGRLWVVGPSFRNAILDYFVTLGASARQRTCLL